MPPSRNKIGMQRYRTADLEDFVSSLQKNEPKHQKDISNDVHSSLFKIEEETKIVTPTRNVPMLERGYSVPDFAEFKKDGST